MFNVYYITGSTQYDWPQKKPYHAQIFVRFLSLNNNRYINSDMV